MKSKPALKRSQRTPVCPAEPARRKPAAPQPPGAHPCVLCWGGILNSEDTTGPGSITARGFSAFLQSDRSSLPTST